MNIYCFDLEGVFIPEIWHRIARHYRIGELKLTTRDISDFNKLMQHRIRILRKEKIRLQDLQKVINPMRPFAGAKKFLGGLQEKNPVIILSDTFYEFVGPVMKRLGNPPLFCNWLQVDKQGYIVKHILRDTDGKRKAVRAFQKMGFRVSAAGDSFNDLSMLKAADRGILYCPPDNIRKKTSGMKVAKNYRDLQKYLKKS